MTHRCPRCAALVHRAALADTLNAPSRLALQPAASRRRFAAALQRGVPPLQARTLLDEAFQCVVDWTQLRHSLACVGCALDIRCCQARSSQPTFAPALLAAGSLAGLELSAVLFCQALQDGFTTACEHSIAAPTHAWLTVWGSRELQPVSLRALAQRRSAAVSTRKKAIQRSQVIPQLVVAIAVVAVMLAAVPRSLAGLLDIAPAWAATASAAVGVSAASAVAVPLLLVHAHATVAIFVAVHHVVPWRPQVRRDAPPRGSAWLAGPPYLTSAPQEAEEDQHDDGSGASGGGGNGRYGRQ